MLIFMIFFIQDLGLDHCSWAVTQNGIVRTKGQQVRFNLSFSPYFTGSVCSKLFYYEIMPLKADTSYLGIL